ncbi:MAG: FkbM family methyltransferase [Bacteroidota bacterium]
MKKFVQSFLQKLLGFERYLLLFSWFKIKTLHLDGPDKEGDFLYFLSLLPEDGHVLDIGANIGIMTVLMAQRCPKGKVYAYEPVPENYRALERICRFMKVDNVALYQAALGPSEGTVKMQMPEIQGVRMQGLSHVVHDSIEGFGEKGSYYEVPQLVLDISLRERSQPITAIKMDVENYEQFVLQGATELLRTDRPILYLELWDNENRERCFSLLRGLGYEVQVLVEKKLQVFEAQRHQQHNFFFVPTQS